MSFSRFALLAVTAIATITPSVLWAQDARPSPGATAQPPAPALNPKILAKLLDLISTYGVNTQMPGPITDAMGVTTGAQTWPVRQFAVQANATGVVHAIAIGPGTDPVILVSMRGPAAISIFRVRRDGTLVSGVDYFVQTRQTTALTPAQAVAGFGDECAFWATHMDSLPSSG
jgi:hypothetical protein